MVSILRKSQIAVAMLAVVLVMDLSSDHAAAQFLNTSAVGGVAIDVDGLVSAPTVEQQQELLQIRKTAIEQAPADLMAFTELRAVSLRGLEAAIAKHLKTNEPLPEEVQCLAGLQRIRYVLVYPERNDIVLAGPAEGWEIDGLGNVVGVTTGRPVLLLDDLMTALRARQSSRMQAISCSIDPTPEGLKRVGELYRQLGQRGNMGDPKETEQLIEEVGGPQVITVSGVPTTSHFARVLVAADFRMKRLGMNLQPAPIDGLPSYLQLMKTGRGGMQSSTPRWWLAPMYDPIATDADGLAWELRGQGVKCMTEDDFVNSQGEIVHSGKAGPIAKKWAELMTKQFEKLCGADSAFGHLRNVMDLAVVAALIERQGLLERVELQLPGMLQQMPTVECQAPRQVATTASLLKKGRTWVISASGGVQIYPWQIAEKTEQTESLDPIRDRLTAEDSNWWWQ